MKISIISDIHDNLINLRKCLDICGREGVEEIICCGDVTNDDTLSFLSENFKNKIHLVSGNMEVYKDGDPRKYENIKFYGRVGRNEFDNILAGFCHEPFLFDYVLKKGKSDFVFYGHTHKPWIEKKEGVNFINPGNLSGTGYRPSFAIWETGDAEPRLMML